MRHAFAQVALLGLMNVSGLGAQEKAGAPSFDACGLVGKAVVDGIMGGDTLNARPRPAELAFGTVQTWKCKYRGRDWTVETHVEEGRGPDGIKEYMKTLKGVVKQTTESDARAIPGIGDEAWWGPISPTNGILSIVVGSELLWVQTYGKEPGAGSLEKTRAVAEKALASYKVARKK